MPYDVPSAFIEIKNRQVNTPVWLYRLSVSDDPADDLFFTEYDTDISYYRTDADGVDYDQVYTRYQMRHGGISSNKNGKIDTIEVTLSNVDRAAQYYLENFEALRGRRVVIRQAFIELLDNPAAHIEDVQYIDQATYNEQAVTYTLTTSVAIYEAKLPRRVYMRDYCPHKYKGEGCWPRNEAGGYDPPGEFGEEWTNIYTPEMSGEIPKGWSGVSDPVLKTASFTPLRLAGLFASADDDLTWKFKLKYGRKYLNIKNIQGSLIYAGYARFVIYDSAGKYMLYNMTPDLESYSGDWITFTKRAASFTTQDGFSADSVKKVGLEVCLASDRTVNEAIPFYLKDVKVRRVTPWSFSDVGICAKTFEACRQHNNTGRFGGFPTIPKRRMFRVG